MPRLPVGMQLISAPIPLDENERLSQLSRYEVAPDSPEPRFDSLAWLARYVFDAPYAFISFLDREFQWFKSQSGTTLQPLPRALSLCGHAVSSGDAFVIADTHRDYRFHDHPLVVGAPYIRFYVSVPLVARPGQVIGTIAVFDTEPRTPDKIDEREMRALFVLAGQTMELLEADMAMREQIAEQDELRRSNSALQDFAIVASHDLQEPLRKVTAMGERLRARSSDSLGDEGREYLDRILGSASRMNGLVINLMSYGRLRRQRNDTEPLTLESTPLDAVLRDALDDLEERIANSGASVQFDPLPTICADPVQIRQLFQNLIANALKFVRDGVRPEVQVRATPGDGYVEIRFIDNGIGFATEEADRIFEPFMRLHSRLRYQGTGLGLAICREIAERHGGTLRATGVKGEGATFILTLPLPPDGKPTSQEAEPS